MLEKLMMKFGKNARFALVSLTVLSIASTACSELKQDRSADIALATKHAENSATRAEAAQKRAETKIAVIESGPQDAAIANPPVAEDTLDPHAETSGSSTN